MVGRPDIKAGEWITVGPNHIDARIFMVISPTELSVDYMQQDKPARDTVVLRDGQWQFELPGATGRTLLLSEEKGLARGPFRQ